MDLGSLTQFYKTNVQSLLTGNNQVFGLDIGSSAIKLVQIKETKGAYALQKFGMKPLEAEVIVDGTVMNPGRVIATIKELVQEHSVKLKNVAMSISGHSVIVKKINLPPMPESELESQVKLAAEQYIPFDINEVNLDFYLLNPNEMTEEGETQSSVLLVAAKKDKVSEFTELVIGAGLTPVILDVDAFAIENMYGVNYDVNPEQVTTLVNIGASVMNVNILKAGTSVFTRDISVGGNRYTEAIQREMGMSFEKAETSKRRAQGNRSEEEDVTSAIEGVNAELSSEIARTIDYFKTSALDVEVDRIVMCGGCAKVEGLVQQLSDRMGVTVEIANPFSRIDTTGADVDQEMLSELGPQASVGVGLALRFIGDR